MKEKEVRPNKRKKKKRKQQKKTSRKSSQGNHGKRKKSEKRFSIPKFHFWKVILGLVIAGLLGLFYLKHVFATQALLQKVQKMDQKYKRSKRLHDNYRLTYDRMIGPAEIYKKAKKKGFINGGPAEKIIEVPK